MKVILLKDIEGTGYEGDLVDVKAGFANNYLFRNGLARVADAQALSEYKNRLSAESYKEESMRGDAEKIAAEINEKTITIQAKAGSTGRLFGSVTTTQIAEAIKEQLGAEVDRRKISLEGDIKTHGTFTAVVAVISDVMAAVYVVVTGEVEASEENEAVEAIADAIEVAEEEAVEEAELEEAEQAADEADAE